MKEMQYYTTHWFGKKFLSHPRSAWFSWKSKPDIKSGGFNASYLLQMFFLVLENYCYFQIFPNECTVLIKSFEKRFEATPFFAVLCRWRKFLLLITIMQRRWAGPTIPLQVLTKICKKQSQVEDLSKSFKIS